VTVFGPEYAQAYDTLYNDKDYSAECDLLERVFSECADHPVRSVLDLGCGTGGHAAVLTERGYRVVGVDRSPEMLRVARKRVPSARFETGDISSVQLHETFDAALIMFAVLGYLTETSAVKSALATVRQHLRPRGLFFADMWYGPAVLAQRPAERVKIIDTPAGGQIIRVASSQLDVRRNVCNVEYQLWHLDRERVCGQVRERHSMRYFFEPELESLLTDADFTLERICAFPNVHDDPSEQTWNIAAVARAR
jgi:SAM-dependent methyltransferase